MSELKKALQAARYKAVTILCDGIIHCWMFILRRAGMTIHTTAKISLKAKLDFTNPSGIVIGEESYVGGALILAHDFVHQKKQKLLLAKDVL